MKKGILGFYLAVLLATISTAKADVTFAQSGGNLIININQPISLIFSQTYSGTIFYIDFANLFTTPSGFFSTAATPTIPMTINGSPSTQTYFAQGNLGNGSAYDGYLAFQYSSFTAGAGQPITVPTGTYTVANWFGFGGAPPNSATTARILSQGGTQILSSTVAVPEPSSIALIAAAGLGLRLLRRRRA